MLTGTPLQNNVEELYSLLSFLEPKQFASSEAFMAEFGKLETEAQVDKLKAVSGWNFHVITCDNCDHDIDSEKQQFVTGLWQHFSIVSQWLGFIYLKTASE